MKQIEVKVLRSPVSEKYFRPNMAGVYNGVDKIRLGDAWFDYSKTDDRWYVEDETGLSIASFDFALKTKLDALINEAAEEIYTDDFKRGSSFGTPENKLDTLGIMISKYCNGIVMPSSMTCNVSL